MLTTQQPVFRKFWHAVMPLAMLQDGQVQPFTLLGVDLVLFLDDEGQPAALRDRCCHRTARLSKGRCVDGALQCGYHGWTYNARGRVIRIPQYDAERPIPADYCTPAYRCIARYGYAWVALDEPIAPIPELPEFDATGWRTIFQFYERWATSPLRALENSFDNSHFSFVHRATFGVAAQPKPSRYELVEQRADDGSSGFYAETVIAAANPPAYHRVSGSTEPVTQRHMRNAYYLPFMRRLDIEYPSGVRHVIVNAFTPIDDGQHPARAMAVPQRQRRSLPGAVADRLRLHDHARGQGHPGVHRPRCAGRHAPARHRALDGIRPSRHADPQAVDGAAEEARRERSAPLSRATLAPWIIGDPQ